MNYKMKFVKAFLIWLVLILLAIVNGAIRSYVTEPLFGANIALPLSGIVLSVMIFVTTYLLISKIGKSKPFVYILIGVMWLVLSNLFDFVMTIVAGNPLSDFIGMFDITTGNLWSMVVVVCLISPILTAKIKKIICK